MDFVSALPPPAQPEMPLLEKLRKRLESGERYLQKPKLAKGEIQVWFNQLRSRLADLYGAKAPIVQIYREKAQRVMKDGISHEEFAWELKQLQGMLNHWDYCAGTGVINPVSTRSVPPQGRDVFVIHGHDELNTRRLTQMLYAEFHLNPIAMITKPGMSRPLIDKYEDTASHCTFAFALVTPDDVVVKADREYNQARPNVIFELGWFVGRLGKQRVTILLKNETQIHSDIDGVSRIHFDDNVEDKYLDIKRELVAAGLI